MNEIERLEKAVVDTYDTYAYAFNVWQALGDPFVASAQDAWCEAKQELKEYRNYKKAQLIQKLAEIVIRHDIENT